MYTQKICKAKNSSCMKYFISHMYIRSNWIFFRYHFWFLYVCMYVFVYFIDLAMVKLAKNSVHFL